MTHASTITFFELVGRITGWSTGSWGVEWLGGSMLNFYVRGGDGRGHAPFRAIQADIEGAAAAMSSSQHSGSGWVRVAMAYLLRSNKRIEWGDHPV